MSHGRPRSVTGACNSRCARKSAPRTTSTCSITTSRPPTSPISERDADTHGERDARRGSERLFLQPLDEPPQDANPYFVLAGRILDAVLDIGIVVDLHHHDPVGRLLEVDAVEPVADRPGRPYGEVHHVARRLIEVKGAVTAFARRAVGMMFEDLPMSARHSILAYEQGLARQYADP